MRITAEASRGWSGIPKCRVETYSDDALSREVFYFDATHRSLIELTTYWQESRETAKKRTWQKDAVWGGLASAGHRHIRMKDLPAIPREVAEAARHALIEMYKNAIVIVADMQ